MSTTISNQPRSISIPELTGPALSITAGGLAGTAAFSIGTLASNAMLYEHHGEAGYSAWNRVGANAGRGLVLGAVALADYELVRHVRPEDDPWISAGKGALIGAGVLGSNVLAVTLLGDVGRVSYGLSGKGRAGIVAIAAGAGALIGAATLAGWSIAQRD